MRLRAADAGGGSSQAYPVKIAGLSWGRNCPAVDCMWLCCFEAYARIDIIVYEVLDTI